MWGRIRLGLLALASVILVACGGGGGGSDAPSSGGDFTLSTYSLSFAAANSSALVPAQYVEMSNIGSSVAYVVVQIPQAASTWLKVGVRSGASYATVTVDPRSLAAGSYATTVRVQTSDAAGKPLAYRDVTVSLTVGAAASSSSSSSSSSSASSSAGAGSQSSSVPAVSWSAYDGSSHPGSGGSLRLATGGYGSFAYVSGSVPDSLPASASSSSASTSSSSSSTGTAYFMDYMTINGDGTLRLDSSANALNRSLIRGVNSPVATPSYPRKLTFMARVLPHAGLAYDVNTRMAEFELAFGSSRVVLVLRGDANSGNVRLQTPEEGGSDAVAQLDMSQPHIFQVTVTLTDPRSGTISVYADGNPAPIIGPVTSSNLYHTFASGQDYIQFGDNRNVVFRSDLDWMIWTTQGAYSPAELKGKLPLGIGVTTGY